MKLGPSEYHEHYAAARLFFRGCLSLPSLPPGPMFLLGGLCPWAHVPSEGSLSRGYLSGWSLSRGFVPRGVCVQGGPCPGGLWPGESVSRRSVSRGSLSRRCLCRETPWIRKVGGTHPTGMLPCFGFCLNFLRRLQVGNA